MDLDALTVSLLKFVQAHQRRTLFIVGALAFAESLAFLSFLVPSTIGSVDVFTPLFQQWLRMILVGNDVVALCALG